MRTRLLIGAVLAGLCWVVPAAATPPTPAYSWTGFYIGGNAGYGWGNSDFGSAANCPAPADCPYSTSASMAIFGAAGTGSFSPNGFTGGIQGGYNWQAGSVVAGVEIDYVAFRRRETQAALGAPAGEGGTAFVLTTGIETDRLFTARGRLGWTIAPTMLLYGTAGVAVTDLSVFNAFTDNAVVVLTPDNATGASRATKRKTGLAVGGGVEWAWLSNWSVKAEYLFVDFGSVSTTAAIVNPSIAFGSPTFLETSADLRTHILRFGLNYRF